MKKLFRLGLLLLTFAFVVFAAVPSQAAITVDVGAPLGPVDTRATGFLHTAGFGAPIQPDTLIAPLRPRLIREVPPNARLVYQYFTNLGARVETVISNGLPSFGHPGEKNISVQPGDGGSCINGAWVGGEATFAQLQTEVQALVQADINAGVDPIYDIWNEPDTAHFWGRTDCQFYETAVRIVQAIRSVRPNAQIVGPSVTSFDIGWITRFLSYMKASNTLPTYLSWHDLNESPIISANVDAIRSWMASNGVSVSGIDINEYTDDQTPGLSLAFIAQIDRSRVYGNRTCWGRSDCPTYDGTIINWGGTYQPLPVWHVYKRYAEFTGQSIAVTPGTNQEGVASYDSASGMVRGVFGHYLPSGAEDVQVTFTRLPFSGSVRVVTERIVKAGYPVAPAVVSDSYMTVSNSSLIVTFPSLGDREAFTVQIYGSGGGGGGDTQAPSVPTGLTATAVSSSQINLSWSASTDDIGLTGYKVYRGGTQITTVTGTTYNDTGLSPATTYSYTVAAYDAAGNTSGQSSSVSATTQSTASFGFSLSSGGAKSVTQGSSVSNTITAILTSGTAQAVSFSASGLPTGTTGTFSPTSCNATCSTTLTIATTAPAPTGTYTITVTGTGGGVTQTTTLTLTISGAIPPPGVRDPGPVELPRFCGR